MKFACPNCSAMYRIADEKIPPRGTVGMKCRKCAHHIELTAASGDKEHLQVRTRTQASMLPPVAASRAAALPHRDVSPGRDALTREAPASRDAAFDAARDRVQPVSPPNRLSAAPPRPGAAMSWRPPAASGVKPQTSGSVPPRPPRPMADPRVPVARGLTAATQTAAVTRQETDVAPAVAALSETPRSVAEAPVVTSEPLTDFFHQSVQGGVVGSAAAEAPLGQTPDEWFVGVDRHIIGPLSIEQFRARFRSGEIRLDCLAWRDGFDEWQPVASFPELTGVLASAHVVSLPPAPLPAAEARPLAAVAATPPSPASVAHYEDAEPELPLKPGRGAGIPWATWFAILGAFAFGMAVIYVFAPQEVREVVKVVEAPPAAPGTAVPASELEPAADGTLAAGLGTSSGGAHPGVAPKAPLRRAGTPAAVSPESASVASTSPTSTSSTAGKGLLAQIDLPTTSGPGPVASGDQGVARSEGLDSAAISRTVQTHSPGVKRSCWQPALNSRSPNAPSSARVVVTINVAPSGQVRGVQTSGDPKGYPGLASCISGRVAAWQFPASGGPTTAKVPFVFAAQ